jgi:putative protease
MFKPELLAPAGSFDKLKAAVSYGADAVYLAGQRFGLRSAADNFTPAELEEGVAFAHARGVKVYVTLNSFPFDRDMDGLTDFIKQMARVNVDGVIVSDMGVVSVIRHESQIPIHLSTQASCLNEPSAQLWKKMGVKRLILGREVSIQDAGAIKRATGLEVELFIHGSMCMAYSGNCTISNYTKGRDSNRGGCAQSCRFSYKLDYPEGQELEGRFFMSSKDMLGVDLLPFFIDEQIDSVKVEGRMRSILYAGVLSKTYRQAIDLCVVNRAEFQKHLPDFNAELATIPHREYMHANLVEPADHGSVLHTDSGRKGTYDEFAGVVRKVIDGKQLLLEVRSAFCESETLELLPFQGEASAFSAVPIFNSLGNMRLEQAKVNTLVRIPFVRGAEAGHLIRIKRP